MFFYNLGFFIMYNPIATTVLITSIIAVSATVGYFAGWIKGRFNK